MAYRKLSRVLQGWFKGTGKPNSVDGEWNIHQVIEYRRIMAFSHHLEVYTATSDNEAWDRLFKNRSRNDIGKLNHLRRRLKMQGCPK